MCPTLCTNYLQTKYIVKITTRAAQQQSSSRPVTNHVINQIVDNHTEGDQPPDVESESQVRCTWRGIIRYQTVPYTVPGADVESELDVITPLCDGLREHVVPLDGLPRQDFHQAQEYGTVDEVYFEVLDVGA